MKQRTWISWSSSPSPSSFDSCFSADRFMVSRCRFQNLKGNSARCLIVGTLGDGGSFAIVVVPHTISLSAMSSSSAIATASRSPSPLTPESSDSLEQVAIHDDLELSSWYHSLRSGKSCSGQAPWDSHHPSPYSDPAKVSDEHMLCFNDLIDEHAYDEYAHSQCLTLFYQLPFTRAPSSAVQYPPQSSPDYNAPAILSPVSPLQHSPAQTISVADILVPSHTQVSPTKPIPPPASRPRKNDPPTANQRVICPPKDSCYKYVSQYRPLNVYQLCFCCRIFQSLYHDT